MLGPDFGEILTPLICGSRLGWRELKLVGSILEQRELGDSRLM